MVHMQLLSLYWPNNKSDTEQIVIVKSPMIPHMCKMIGTHTESALSARCVNADPLSNAGS